MLVLETIRLFTFRETNPGRKDVAALHKALRKLKLPVSADARSVGLS